MVFDFLTRIWNRIYLSFLWVICCIPLVTIGASTTAYCYMLFKMKSKEEGYITRGFFGAFKREFKQSTIVWGVLFVLLIVLYFDSNFVGILIDQYGSGYEVLVPVYYLLLFLTLAELVYVFPYIARFQNTTKNVLKNSFLMATRHLGYTFTILLLDILILMFALNFLLTVIIIVPVLIGSINVSMLNVIFRKYM